MRYPGWYRHCTELTQALWNLGTLSTDCMQMWYLYFSIIGLSPLPEFPSIPEIRVNRYFKACAWDHVKIACMSSKIYILMCIYHCMCTGLLNKFFFFCLFAICWFLCQLVVGSLQIHFLAFLAPATHHCLWGQLLIFLLKVSLEGYLELCRVLFFYFIPQTFFL